MSTIMMRHIYAIPLHMVIFLMLALLIVWAMLSLHQNQRKRSIINAVLCSITALTILYATILTRTPGNYEVILTPFATFAAARIQRLLDARSVWGLSTPSTATPLAWRRWMT